MSIAEVPRLERHEIQAVVEELLRAGRRQHLIAIHGTGDETELTFEGGMPPMSVVNVRSELDLRAKMPALTEPDPRRVFLVPFTGLVPLDLSCRFALEGRVRRVGAELRLAKMFGAHDVDVDAKQSPLAAWLLKHPGQFTVREGRLTKTLLWNTWLKQVFGLDTEGGLALDALLAWAALSGRADAFTDGPGTDAALRGELLEVLERALGPAGPLAWCAWEQGRGKAVLEYAVLFEALMPLDDAAIRMWVKQRLRADLNVTDEAVAFQVAASVAPSAAAALRYVERSTDAATVRAIVRSAEERVDDAQVRAALAPSLRLPAALDARLAALGNALLEGAAVPTAPMVAEAEKLLQRVEAHSLASQSDTHFVERGWMAVRLLAWLATPNDPLPAITPYDAVETLGEWYAEQGGYVDWARRVARGPAVDAFGRGVQAVVEAADRARRTLDRRFAAALAEWHSAGQPSRGLVPIDKALERVAAPFLEERSDRRLLVLLLDGMAWAQAVELLDSLSQRAWGPLAWHASRKGRIGNGMYPVMLASVPSVTEVSRAAFFAGKPTPPGRSEDTQKDRDRFRDNKTIAKFLRSTEVPTLLLRSDSHTKGGSASEEALRLVADPDRRVVGIVVNTIDDSLKANPATRHPWGVGNIASLPDLLQKARESGRAVLLASDHGHVPADLLEFKGPVASPGGGARWRALTAESDPIQDFEVRFPAGRAWAPRGAWGVALMADESGRWGSSTHAGEHGGATLAEIVAPCVLVGAEDLEATAQPEADDALRTRPPFVPSWWHLAVRVAVPIPPDSVTAVAEPPTAKPRQLALPTLALPEKRPTPPPKRPSSPPGAPASAFARSKVLEARATDPSVRKNVAKAVDFLLARNGVATAAAFAAEMVVTQRRVAGQVAMLQEVLNVDGYEVLRFDALAQHVNLDVGKLRLLFEVPA